MQTISIRDVHLLERLPSRANIDDFDEVSLKRQGYASWFDSIAELLTGALRVGGAQGYLTATTNVLQFSLAACPEFESLAEERGIDTSFCVCPGDSLNQAVENLSENMTFSLFSYGPAL